MGWASGSQLFEEIIPIIEEYVPEEKRTDVYKNLVDAFENYDWDTQNEVWGISKYLDEVFKERYPEDFEE